MVNFFLSIKFFCYFQFDSISEVLIGALARILYDDWKKSFDLATNITSIFLNFSFYNDFHPILAHYKVRIQLF